MLTSSLFAEEGFIESTAYFFQQLFLYEIPVHYDAMGIAHSGVCVGGCKWEIRQWSSY